MGGIWQGGDKMGVFDVAVYSLTGIATVFMILVCLAIAIIVVSKILNAMGLADVQKKPEAKAAVKTSAVPPVAAKTAQEDTQEYAAILATISEHTRVPVERLKIVSITKR